MVILTPSVAPFVLAFAFLVTVPAAISDATAPTGAFLLNVPQTSRRGHTHHRPPGGEPRPPRLSPLPSTGGDEGEEPSWYLTPPESLDDFFELGSLLFETFDDADKDDEGGSGGGTVRALVRRTLRPFVVQRYASRYASTVRRMIGKKHALILAKETRPGGRVVGAAEAGVSAYRRVTRGTKIAAADNNNDARDSSSVRAVASVGILAVSPGFRRSGIGRALASAAERTAGRWSEEVVFAAVEPSNAKALEFFQRVGFEVVMEPTIGSGDDEGPALVEISVQELWETEVRPHILLRKSIKLEDVEEDCGSGQSVTAVGPP